MIKQRKKSIELISKLTPFHAVHASRFGESGGVLILTLWLVVFLSTLVVMLGAQALGGRRLMQGYTNRVQGALALETMRSRLEAALKLDETEDYDSLNDPWANRPDFFQDVRIADGGPSVSLVSGQYYGARDEERLININTASFALLKQLFMTGAGLDDKTADLVASAVQDWRDLETDSTSAEVDTEQGVYSDYPCKNELFESREELMLVYGMDESIYKAVADLITVYGDGRVNMNTVEPGVLLVLGAPQSLVEKVEGFRTADDGFFEDVAAIEPKLQAHAGLSTAELNALSRMKSENWVGVKSDHFRLPVEMKSRGRIWRTSMIVDRKGKIWEIG